MFRSGTEDRGHEGKVQLCPFRVAVTGGFLVDLTMRLTSEHQRALALSLGEYVRRFALLVQRFLQSPLPL